MGSRGAFINVDRADFRFNEGGKKYNTVGFDEKYNIKYLVQTSGSVKIPDFSHSADRTYAIIQNGRLKQIGIYVNHNKIASIDLLHPHKNADGKTFKGPHVHTDLHHSGEARELNSSEKELLNVVMKGVKKYL